MTPSWRAREMASPSEEWRPLPDPPSKEESLPSPIPTPTRLVHPKSAVNPPTRRWSARGKSLIERTGRARTVVASSVAARSDASAYRQIIATAFIY